MKDDGSPQHVQGARPGAGRHHRPRRSGPRCGSRSPSSGQQTLARSRRAPRARGMTAPRPADPSSTRPLSTEPTIRRRTSGRPPEPSAAAAPPSPVGAEAAVVAVARARAASCTSRHHVRPGVAGDDVPRRGHADAIVVLGAAQYDGRPSPVLEARLDQALRLYEAGIAPRDRGHRRAAGGRHVHRGDLGLQLAARPGRARRGDPQGGAGAQHLRVARRRRRASCTTRDLDEVMLVSDGYHALPRRTGSPTRSASTPHVSTGQRRRRRPASRARPRDGGRLARPHHRLPPPAPT